MVSDIAKSTARKRSGSMAEINPDWSIGAKEPTKRQIAKWEAIKYVVSPLGNGLYLSGFPDDSVQNRMKELDIGFMFSCTRAVPPGIPGVAIIRTPFDDNVNELPDLQQLQWSAETIADLVEDGEIVLIHCMYGLNRSALLAAHAMALLDPEMRGKDILTAIRSARPGALHNALFADAVTKLNKTSP